jgi:hypothetical protein
MQELKQVGFRMLELLAFLASPFAKGINTQTEVR